MIFSVLFEELGLIYALILSLIFIYVYSYGQKKFKQTLQLSSSTVLYLGIFGGLAMLMLNQSNGAERIDSLAFNSLFSYLIFGIFLGF